MGDEGLYPGLVGLVGPPGRSIGDVGENDGDEGLNDGVVANRPAPPSMRGDVGEYPALGEVGEYPPKLELKGDVGDVLKGLVAPRPEYGLIDPTPPKPPPPYSVPNPAGVSEPAPWMGEKFPAAGELRLW